MIRARGLVKTFGSKVAVDGIDIDVEPGEAFGFLGPNGAGKSTTMRMIGCVSMRTSGELSVLGMDPARQATAIKARLGVVPQGDGLDDDLTVRQNLQVYARFFGMSRKQASLKADEMLEFAQLSDRANERTEPLSGGMKRRLTIARALVSDPTLLLLDEPTTGLDPQARHLLWERLRQLRSQGVSLVLTTHYMDEAEQLCDRLVVMDGGRIVALGTPRELIAEHAGREVLEVQLGQGENEPLVALAREIGDRVETLPGRLLVFGNDGDAMAEQLRPAGLNPGEALVRRASLEDVFLRLTGRTLVD